MGRSVKYVQSDQALTTPKLRPARTPQARQNQMVALAIDLAQKQLRQGTASSQVITHYLKLGSTKQRIQKQILLKEKQLITAKTQALKSAKRIEQLYTNALSAMRAYSGQNEQQND